MNAKTLWAVGALIVIVALGVYGYASYKPNGVVSNENESAIQAMVVEYGTTLQTPSKIDIVSIVPRASGDAFQSYQVEANVVEYATALTTNEEAAQPTATYPISMTVEKCGDGWMITALTKGDYSELPQRTTITGIWGCLPHKGDGPHTMECAFGIAKDQSKEYYAVDTSAMSIYPIEYPTGTHVKIEGIVVPADQLSSIQKYNVDGIIRATSIQKI